MLEVMAAVALGIVGFFGVATLALRLLMEALTERNLAYIRAWEAEAMKTPAKPAAKARMGRHRRGKAAAGAFAFADSVVK